MAAKASTGHQYRVDFGSGYYSIPIGAVERVIDGNLNNSAQSQSSFDWRTGQVAALIIRAHKRFGVCRGIKLRRECDKAVVGLLVEVSLEGCRISNINSEWFAFDDCVEVEIEGWKSLHGRVRWHHDGMIGLRLAQPFHNAELVELVNFCRDISALTEAKRA